MAERKWRPSPPALVAAFERAARGMRAAEQRKMFGYPAVFVNGNMFAGLVRDTMILRLGETDRTKLLALPGARHFVAMGGRRMKEWMVVPSVVLKSPPRLKSWLGKALARSRALPPKRSTR